MKTRFLTLLMLAFVVAGMAQQKPKDPTKAKHATPPLPPPSEKQKVRFTPPRIVKDDTTPVQQPNASKKVRFTPPKIVKDSVKP